MIQIFTSIFDLQKAFKYAQVDLISLNKASPFLQYQVAMEGKVLYEREEGCFLEFAVKAMKEYEDTRHFERYHKEIIDDFCRKGNDG